MGKRPAIILTVLLLSGVFAFTTYASYSGFGLIASGTSSSRVGSISAPNLFSGGFGGSGFSSGGK